MKNLAFHSLLRWKIIVLAILTTSLIHFFIRGWENLFFELGGRIEQEYRDLLEEVVENIWEGKKSSGG